MKKSTVLLIFIIYLASIVVIGFFGMKIKVYDEIKYVKSIDMSVEAESKSMFVFQYTGIDSSMGNKEYSLTVNFSQHLTGNFENKNGNIEERNYIALSLIPKVTYDTGDVANSEEESITYSHSSPNYEERELFSLSDRGQLICFRAGIAFRIYVDPAQKSGNGTGAIITVYVINE